ncbi:MAG: stage V sporulation protein AE [Chloroflexi bacterium]|nr:stage V sporulation protein AE [Chloroflexota bacterium]
MGKEPERRSEPTNKRSRPSRRRGQLKTTIVITDGDAKAVRIVTRVAAATGAEAIATTAGAPTRAEPKDIVEAVERSRAKTVLVMADDAGDCGPGPGERVIVELARKGHINAAIAVASDTRGVRGIRVTESVTVRGKIVHKGVNKRGQPKPNRVVRGDTVDALNGIEVPVVGIGDLGKAPGGRSAERILTKAIDEAERLAQSPAPPKRKRKRKSKDHHNRR